VVGQAFGTSVIYVADSEAGSLDSVRVGDQLARVRARWGEPSLVRPSLWGYEIGDWIVVVRFEEGSDRVVQLGIGYLAGRR